MKISENKKERQHNIALKAGIWYIVSSITVNAISVITTPIFTRAMSQEEYGLVSNLTAWFSLLMPFCTFHLGYSIGRAKLDFKNQMNYYVGAMQLLSLVITSVIAVVSVFFIERVSLLMELPPMLIIFLIIYLFSAPTISFMQAKYRYEYNYKKNIFIAWYIAITTTVLSLVLLIQSEVENVLARSIGIIIPYTILSTIYWIKGVKEKTIKCNITYWSYGIKISAPLIIHGLSLNLLAQSDRIFITKICGAEYTAIYSIVYTCAYLISVIMNAISEAWRPWFQDNYYAGNYGQVNLNAKKLVVLGCYIALASIVIAPEIILLLGGDNYLEGLKCAVPVVLGTLCQYVYTHYVNIEMYMKKTKFVSQGTILAAIVNFVLNSIFIPKYGYSAAAYTTMVSYFVVMIIHYLITKYILKIKLYNDGFMFGSIMVTCGIGIGIEFVYNCIIARGLLALMGFISFLYYFREYWLDNIFLRRRNNE